MEEQTAAATSFEVLVVANGPDDGTPQLVRDRAKRSRLHIRLVQTSTSGFANARNLGIHAARGEFITWIDDDDWVSPSYVSTMLTHADIGRVVIPIFADVDQDDATQVKFVNYINRQLLRYSGQTVGFAELPTAANFDAGKVVARNVAASVSYDSELTSGLDVLYWATLILRHNLSVTVPELDSHAVYYRRMRTGSISRAHDEQFGRDRLRCIEKLQQLRSGGREEADFVRVLQGGQASNLGAWLKALPARRRETLEQIDRLDISDFPYDIMNRQSAEQLVIACEFPPAKNSAGLVLAKRMLNLGEPYDLITHRSRRADPTTSCLIRQHLGATTRIGSSAPRPGGSGLATFSDQSFDRLAASRAGDPYARVYSQAPQSAAHLVAAAYKAAHPQTRWTAEFSEPLLVDVTGAKRSAPLPDSRLVSVIEARLASFGLRPPNDNFSQWLETATFALADRIVFTNELQRDYMLQAAVGQDLAAEALEKSEVSHPPTLPKSYYSQIQSGYRLAEGRLNLAYFGTHHRREEMNDLVSGLDALTRQERAEICLHVFTGTGAEKTNAAMQRRGLADCVRVNILPSFLEFLNLTTRFDWLIALDVPATRSHGLNPYFPITFADYLGAGSKIWSIVDPGSTLDSFPVDAKSVLGDAAGSADFLRTIL